MIIHEAKIENIGSRTRCSYRIELETDGVYFSETKSNSEILWIDWPTDYHNPQAANSDAALLICFPIAMRLNEPIRVSGGVSGRLIWNVLEAMSIYQSYFPGYANIVPLEAQAQISRITKSGRLGSFYSGGVDSFYNVAEARRLSKTYGTSGVSDLWLVRGMDIPLRDDAMWENVKSQLITYDYFHENMSIVDIQTNARHLHSGFVAWIMMGFSPILGGIAKCFAPLVGEALIGSTSKYEDIGPHASSPLVDPMWSCDAQLVRHFSSRVNRGEKIRAICDNMPEALKVLRVCWENPNGAYNCGVCEKCLRTQMQLKIYGALDLCPTFECALTPMALERLYIPREEKNFYTRDFWRDLSKQAKSGGFDEYARVIDRKINEASRFASLRNTIPTPIKRQLKTVLGRWG